MDELYLAHFRVVSNNVYVYFNQSITLYHKNATEFLTNNKKNKLTFIEKCNTKLHDLEFAVQKYFWYKYTQIHKKQPLQKFDDFFSYLYDGLLEYSYLNYYDLQIYKFVEAIPQIIKTCVLVSIPFEHKNNSSLKQEDFIEKERESQSFAL